MTRSAPKPAERPAPPRPRRALHDHKGSALPPSSIILCSRNGAALLPEAFASIERAAAGLPQIEAVLVDSASTDATPQIYADYARTADRPVRIRRLDEPGLGRARNAGLEAATGEWIFCLDDDGRYAPDYFQRFARALPLGFDFAGGEILPARAGLDPRVATLRLDRTDFSSPDAVIRAGWIQGANMAFHRRVFAAAGRFNPWLGAGTDLAFEDVEMAARASAFRFCAARLKGLTVFHDHGRFADSPEAEKVVESYDYGRGAYYAHLLLNGRAEPMRFLREEPAGPRARAARRREHLGAARYFEAIAERPEILRARPYPPRLSRLGVLASDLASRWHRLIAPGRA